MTLLKYSLTLFLLFGAVNAFALGENYENIEKANAYVSQGIYVASNTAAANNCLGCEVRITSNPAILHTINVNTAGTTSSLVVFDAYASTTGQRIIANIDTTSKVSLTYDVSTTSSGITISNSGNPPADVTLSYTKR